ncbi:MAG: META domain-containing protein [Saprospiraceae bacterium]|nr:META domain-containing protein [Saprospiraceae bacterium]MDW8229995.1 META domain-containing protein [Saprospiraceae bacterium]
MPPFRLKCSAGAIALSLALAFAACNPKSGQKAGSPKPADNSRISLHWPGTYIGTAPCSDCEGILTEVRLRADNTYEMAIQHMGKSKEIYRRKGSIEWDESGNSIRLVDSDKLLGDVRYRVEENALFQLDARGKRLEGDQANMYRLVKYDADNDVREKYWKLIELHGKPISVAESQQRETHIVLKFSGRVIGSTGCNRLMGSYTLEEGNRLRFSQLASTLMSCPDVPYEGEFLKALERVDSYSLKNDTLSLSKARMAPFARFVVVYLY